MMQKLYHKIFVILFLHNICLFQLYLCVESYESIYWTWISGSEIKDSRSDGTIGVPSTDYYIGGRSGSASWFDETNNILYLFGGIGIDVNHLSGHMNDLWSFSLETKEWTWLSGSNEIHEKGIYGDKGVPSTAKYPGSRSGSVSWFDETNNLLYLFGGVGYDSEGIKIDGYLNDLWSFSPETKAWTWISGNKTEGVASTENFPGGRAGSASWFDKINNRLYLFGGRRYEGETTYGDLNDVWFFSLETKEWEWVSGIITSDEGGIYGVKGEPSPENYPGSRRFHLSWFDETDNIAYIFGGLGFDENEDHGYLNDLWSFSLETKEWTWLSGSKEYNNYGNYGDKGVSSTDYYPNSCSGSATWFDKTNNVLYLLGGLGLNSGSPSTPGALNSLWSYSIDTDEWTWIAGNKTAKEKGYYGEIGEPSTENYPGARHNGASLTDQKRKVIYIFGGTGIDWEDSNGLLNDVWSITNLLPPDPIVTPVNPILEEICNVICILDIPVIINDSISVTNLTITTSSVIIIEKSIHENNGVFINEGEEPINIEGGKIILNFTTFDEEYEYVVNRTKEGEEIEYLLINGKYIGLFDSLEVIPASDSLCKLKPIKTDKKDVYSIYFSLDSGCSDEKSLKWWIILLIVVGILLVITLVFIISVYKIKSLREKIFPYNKRKNKNVESESSNTYKSRLYHNKSKVNPIYK